MPMAELRDKRPIANRVRNCGNLHTGIGGKCRRFARCRNVTGALRGDEAKRTLRRRSGILPVAACAPAYGARIGSKATDDKADLAGKHRRHAEPDARHQ